MKTSIDYSVQLQISKLDEAAQCSRTVDFGYGV